jgi:hypothetical protein
MALWPLVLVIKLMSVQLVEDENNQQEYSQFIRTREVTPLK